LGQRQQRVHVAMELANERIWMIADEPLPALDVTVRRNPGACG